MFRQLLLASSLILLDSFPFSSRRIVGRDCSSFARLSFVSSQWFINRVDVNKVPVEPSINYGIMASSARRRSSARRSAVAGNDAEDLEMRKENLQNEEDVAAESDDQDDIPASGTQKMTKVKKSTKKKAVTRKASESTMKRKIKGSSKKDDVSAATSEDVDEKSDSKSPGETKATKKRVAKKKKGGDDESESDGSPKKKRKSPSEKKEPHQRVTERIELPKLWNAKEALATKGSYSKYEYRKFGLYQYELSGSNGYKLIFQWSHAVCKIANATVSAFKIASWNVAGLRAVLRKDPESLANLCKKHELDMLCLQETKLQESHLDDPKLVKLSNGQLLRDVLNGDGYEAHWSCSTVKKGYSGTAVFTKRHGCKNTKQKSISSFFQAKKKAGADNPADRVKNTGGDAGLPISADFLKAEGVSFNIGQDIDGEGRVIMLDFPFASIANVYVPNSGQKLERLKYRTDEWDNQWLQFMQKRRVDRGKPVIWLGDLNIAHTAQDVWNDGAKHLDTQAGVTPQERASFQKQLDSGFVDAFRKLHPNSQAHYTYWSMRAGNREPNKGLRLDYFICSPDLFSEDSDVIVRDSYMISDHYGSDHCPVVLELEIKKKQSGDI